ncbi:MAG TPA: amidase [Usitatibacter sp.]|nr:amidase [Usitatibacter sp.]
MSRPDDPQRRRFLATAAGGLAALQLPARAETMTRFEHEEATIDSLAARMASGETSAVALANAYLERIARLDRAGPALRAVIELNPDAMAIAEERDRERKAGRVRGPLHGIPILVKDNIATGDRMSTTAGSLGLDGVRAPRDAPLVARLREAGAVLLGKTNLSEWANFRSSNSVSGWSSRGGQTRNPYALDRSPSGSSSGSAVAVAANLCAAAIGTETDGSITSPSACNNLAGLKPTLGLVSGDGIVPIAHSQDTAGPIARSVADCARLMNALSEKPIDFTQHLGIASLKGVRLGVGRQYFGTNEKADAVIEEALQVLKGLGATLVDVEIPSFGKLDEPEFEVLLYEFKNDLKAFFKKHMPDAPFKGLTDVIEFNARNADRTMPIFGQDLLVKAQAKGALTSKEYIAARDKCRRLARAQGIDAVVKKHRVEAIVALTSPPAWLVDPINGDLARGGCTSMAAVAGYPHVTVPAGFASGLPVGISFFGPALADARLLGLAGAFERAAPHRKPPALA